MAYRIQVLRGGWRKECLARLARKMLALMPSGWSFSLHGPFGLGARVWVEFKHRNGRCRTICFSPHVVRVSAAPREGRKATPTLFALHWVDFSEKQDNYPEGSIGSLNGFNYPTRPVPVTDTAAWCVKRLAPSTAR